MCAEYMAH